jgi:hypothetical protein
MQMILISLILWVLLAWCCLHSVFTLTRMGRRSKDTVGHSVLRLSELYVLFVGKRASFAGRRFPQAFF